MTNFKNKQHVHDTQIGFEPHPLDIDMKDRQKHRNRTRKWLAGIALALTLGVASMASRTEASPESETENTFSGIGEFDEHGESGIGVFVDTVMELRPDLIIYETDELTGELEINRAKTRDNIEDKLGVNAGFEGQQLRNAVEGVPQVGSQVAVEYQDGRFSYEPIDK